MSASTPEKLPRNLLSPTDGEQVVELLHERWDEYLSEDEDFRVEAAAVGERLFLSLFLQSPARQETLTLEAQLHLPDLPDEETACHLGLDALDALLGGYLEEDREVFFPVDWSATSYHGQDLAIRGVRRKLALEAQADDLLGVAGEPVPPLDPESV